MQQMNPAAAFGADADADKAFKAEAENLAVIEHQSIYDGIEERLLQRFV